MGVDGCHYFVLMAVAGRVRNGQKQRKRRADLTGAQCLHMLRIELVNNYIENKAQHIVERMEEA
ncbi:hypothetical protein J14TS5_04580 [Paenibacillus lautus]|nr:hypothetical protein J14TS5_04580 [Paenibacillus lautus]